MIKEHTQIQTIRFTKMHGCGNNYIYVYLPENEIPDLQKAAIDWSRQGFGIGSDGLITIEPSTKADFKMRIFNNDGSEAMMCGNGVRCCGKFVRDHHLTEKKEVSFETLAGIKILQLFENEAGVVNAARVDMGIPTLQEPEQFVFFQNKTQKYELSVLSRRFVGTFVSMGNPHFVIFLHEDVENFEIEKYGPLLERHEAFPQRCNIEFANIRPDGSIRMRVWERGSGITMACGTGACATATAAILTQGAPAVNTIVMDGGKLSIEWQGIGTHLFMTGPAETVFEGTINI